MKMAVQMASETVADGGGPFAAVIVKNEEVIAAVCNHVTQSYDPTAHAEIEAIRLAAAKLKTHDLSGCEIYASCEPCPMCLGAIYWAHLDKLYFGSSRHDAAKAGFDDEFIYREIKKPLSERSIPTAQLKTDDTNRPFEEWQKFQDRKEY